jgi:hypothetical protein
MATSDEHGIAKHIVFYGDFLTPLGKLKAQHLK